jgi:hypothetical protein
MHHATRSPGQTLLSAIAAASCAMAAMMAVAQPSPTAPVRVTGTEIQRWLDSDGMAVAGVSTENGCYFLAQGAPARTWSIKCRGQAPFSTTGDSRVVGDQLCTRMPIPNAPVYDRCQDVFRIGDNTYQVRFQERITDTFYRLLP